MDEVIEFIKKLSAANKHVFQVYLFGSRARGDESPKSDYDIAVDWRGDHPSWAEFAQTIRDNIPTLCEVDIIKISEQLSDGMQEKL